MSDRSHFDPTRDRITNLDLRVINAHSGHVLVCRSDGSSVGGREKPKT